MSYIDSVFGGSGETPSVRKRNEPTARLPARVAGSGRQTKLCPLSPLKQTPIQNLIPRQGRPVTFVQHKRRLSRPSGTKLGASVTEPQLRAEVSESAPQIRAPQQQRQRAQISSRFLLPKRAHVQRSATAACSAQRVTQAQSQYGKRMLSNASSAETENTMNTILADIEQQHRKLLGALGSVQNGKRPISDQWLQEQKQFVQNCSTQKREHEIQQRRALQDQQRLNQQAAKEEKAKQEQERQQRKRAKELFPIVDVNLSGVGAGQAGGVDWAEFADIQSQLAQLNADQQAGQFDFDL
jgi:hypothetical protein